MSKAHDKTQIQNISTCRDVAQLVVRQVHNKSKQWSVGLTRLDE